MTEALAHNVNTVVADLLWPAPPDDETYVSQTLSGGDYLSTGMFPRHLIGPKGGGRTVDNCSRVTTLMWDADLATLYEALLAARRRPVPAKRAQLKAQLWRLPTDHLTVLRKVLIEQLIPVWSDVMGVEPTAVIDSGWGVHIHLAVQPALGGRVAELQQLHADLTRRMNERAAGVARELRPALRIQELFDRMTVGAQLCRPPGTTNLKCEWQPQPVLVLDCNPDAMLDVDSFGRLSQDIGHSNDLFDGFGELGHNKPTVAPDPGVDAPPRWTETDFSAQMIDGRTWSDIAYALRPGERVRVKCPFGGSSLGSGFFARESDGRARYYSHKLEQTFWDVVVRVPSGSGSKVQLVMGEPKRRGALPRPLNTVQNLRMMMAGDPAFDLWWCEFTHRVMDGEEPLTDSWWLGVREHMESQYGWMWSAGERLIVSTADLTARDTPRHRPRTWLLGLKWDGTPRLETWMARALGAPANSGLVRQYSLRWPIGLVARMLDAGCKNDVMLVLQGKQGIGKSQLLEAFCSNDRVQPGMFVDSRIRLDDKDAMMVLQQAWVYEDAELLAHSGAGHSARKAFLSSRTDTFRPPYGRTVIKVPRSCVITGSTNDTSLLTDPTGARRYWVVQCSKIDLRWVRAVRDQLLAEAVHRFRNGEQWWLPTAWEGKQMKHNKQWMVSDSYQTVATALSEVCVADMFITTEQFATVVHAHVPKDTRSINRALEAAGWYRVRTSRFRGWSLTEQSTRSWAERKASGQAALGQLRDLWVELCGMRG